MNTDEKLCPFCGETIKVIAIKCKHCHSSLPSNIPNINKEIVLKPCPYCGEDYDIESERCPHCESLPSASISKSANSLVIIKHREARKVQYAIVIAVFVTALIVFYINKSSNVVMVEKDVEYLNKFIENVMPGSNGKYRFWAEITSKFPQLKRDLSSDYYPIAYQMNPLVDPKIEIHLGGGQTAVDTISISRDIESNSYPLLTYIDAHQNIVYRNCEQKINKNGQIVKSDTSARNYLIKSLSPLYQFVRYKQESGHEIMFIEQTNLKNLQQKNWGYADGSTGMWVSCQPNR